jgi:hypothetical protein
MPVTIKSIDQISDFEKLSLMDFSYSRIDTYKSCPSKYFYTYIQKEHRVMTIGANVFISGKKYTKRILIENITQPAILKAESLIRKHFYNKTKQLEMKHK